MSFVSAPFAVFFPAVLCAYWLTPARLRWILLLGASYAFYGWWRIETIPLLLSTSLLTYALALRMRAVPRSAGASLWIAVGANLAVLAFCKYAGFFAESVNALLDALRSTGEVPVLRIVLPLGISFHAFRMIAYAADVRRKTIEPERHLGRFLLFASFFPMLAAGPIERAGGLLPQLSKPARFDGHEVFLGLKRMLRGLLKKVVIADVLAVAVRGAFDTLPDPSAPQVALGAAAFAIQISCDFSGYCDIALGAARTMGIRLSENFDRPYSATSVADFWRRWHITLSSFLRDYVYIPLGGNRRGPVRRSLNVLIVFLVSGLWHGAAWTFVLWGALHGGAIVAATWTEGARGRLARATGLSRAPLLCLWLARGCTFLFLCATWIVFRAQSVGDALSLFSRLARGPWIGAPWAVGLTPRDMLIVALCTAVLIAGGRLTRERDVLPVDRLPTWARWLAYYALLVALLFLGSDRGRDFLYAQF